MYIQLVSVHGRVRGENIEMGCDADTGGQVRYVIELARALGECQGIDQVDLFTRRLRDKRVSEDYSRPIEALGPKARLVRLPCGGPKYMRKEKLWPYLDEFVDEMVTFTRREGRTPTVVHGHYPDAGYIGHEVASIFDVPFIYTAHALGKNKLGFLMEEGWTEEAADKEYNIRHRISVEELCGSAADLIITSTRHERDTLWGAYDIDDEQRFTVIPPGMDVQRFFPYYDYDFPNAQIDERFKQARARMQRELDRFFFNPEKPIILALCRPERLRRIGGLIEVFGADKELQAMANLAVFAGIREDIEEMPEAEQRVLTDILLMMDRYDLYGKMAIPKRHDSEFEVPELYRLAASGGGVFTNPAFTEVFGLTMIESAATGLPVVSTQNGGPRDIVENTESGLLVDVTDRDGFASAIKTMLTDAERWQQCSTSGINVVRRLYSWATHCSDYLESLKEVIVSPTRTPSAAGRPAMGQRMTSVDRLLITDIDGTLLGDEDSFEQLKRLLEEKRDYLGFGIASGRSLELVEEALADKELHIDVIISSVGSEIYYGAGRIPDKGWAAHLRSKWRPDRIREALKPLKYLTLQTAPSSQREFKISYDLDEKVDPEKALGKIRELLSKAKAAHQLIFSHGVYLDILPHRASKGKAVRYLSGKWNIPIERIATAGDSGNDQDMLAGQTAGIVVGNYSPELESLRRLRTSRVYFAKAKCAGGIIQGLQHFGFIDASEHAV